MDFPVPVAKFCPRCFTAIDIAGPPPADFTADEYKGLILEVAGWTDMLPQRHGERFSGYKSRIIMAVQVGRQGRPIPESLMVPLSSAAQKAIDDGKAISHILYIAEAPRPKPPPPEEKTDIRKRREAAKRERDRASPLKLW